MLHFQACQVGEQPSKDGSSLREDYLVKIVVMCDKYDCLDALRAPIIVLATETARILLDHTANEVQSQQRTFINLVDMVIVSTVIKDDRLFSDMTRQLLIQTGGHDSFITASQRVGSHLVPSGIWSELRSAGQ